MLRPAAGDGRAVDRPRALDQGIVALVNRPEAVAMTLPEHGLAHSGIIPDVLALAEPHVGREPAHVLLVTLLEADEAVVLDRYSLDEGALPVAEGRALDELPERPLVPVVPDEVAELRDGPV